MYLPTLSLSLSCPVSICRNSYSESRNIMVVLRIHPDETRSRDDERADSTFESGCSEDNELRHEVEPSDAVRNHRKIVDRFVRDVVRSVKANEGRRQGPDSEGSGLKGIDVSWGTSIDFASERSRDKILDGVKDS